MAKSKNKDAATNLLELGLNKKQMALFFDSISEKYWQDSIDLYKNMEVVRDTLNEKDKYYVLLRGKDKKGYDVNLEIINDKLVHFCSCSNREKKGCDHVGCALIYKLKEGDNDFNLVLAEKDKYSKKEVKLSDLDYFKNLLPKKSLEEKKYMIYFNFDDFDSERQLLSIERGLIKKNGQYGAPVKFQAQTFDSEKWDISKNVRKVLNFINGDDYGMRFSTGGFQKSRFYDVNTDLMMPVFRDIYFEEQEIILGVTFAKHPFDVVWSVSKNKKGKYILEPFFVSGKEKFSLLDLSLLDVGNTALWVFDNDKRKFYEYKHKENLSVARGIIRFPKKLELNEKEMKEFFSRYYTEVLDDFEFELSNDLKRDEKSVTPVAKIYLEKAGTGARVKLKFDYGGQLVDYFSSNKDLVLVENDAIYDVSRDMEYEDQLIETLNEHCIVTHEEKDEFILDCDLIDFVSEKIPKITDLGVEVLGEDKLFNFKIVRNSPKMDFKASQNADWFELKGKVKFGKEGVDIKEILESIFKNKRFVELSDGKKAVIPKNWVDGLKSYAGFFDLTEDVKLSKYHTAILENLVGFSSKADMDNSVKKAIQNFRDFDKVKPVPVSKNVKATLRDYQKAGYDWLNFLAETSFNGILADDMGLGKTLQTLSALQKMKDKKLKDPFLVIVPTSLVFNWKAEAEKFVPNMKVQIHHGVKRDKKNFDKVCKENDLIITTYGVIKNDLELFTSKNFEYIVLDEAHVIKNPTSIGAKSVFALKSNNRLVLSGTPIQNNLTELWSLFNFLNPGYLGSYDFFKENFVSPIEKGEDSSVADSLRKLINPFLLRRTKKVISSELPEKTEMVLRSSFSSEEEELYNNWKEYYRHEINNAIDAKGMNGAKIKILEGLMKLRQLCLHPKLVDSEYEGKSSKFDLLMMEIRKVLNEGHKVLVFSSFVKMLSLVEEEFKKKGMNYSYLDGKTKNREEVVENFQNSEEAQAFLISIKAGGVGLNLTSADYVFIIDPWWNPAVEAQAMDRAHRIGQENKVFVYKMIAEETIEEKILKLQESKKKLVNDLIVEDESVVKNINMKDIKELFS